MRNFFRHICLVSFLCVANSLATEILHPILPPSNRASVSGVIELDEDVYSGDMVVSAEASPMEWWSVYADASFRFVSYSYEYSMKGYIHNYANLHVNGFNETYAGAKVMPLQNIGIDLNWRFPPGEGSQKQRFHRLGISPFAMYKVGENLILGSAFRYNVFLEDENYKPGDEVGVVGSFVWRPFWKSNQKSGWQFSEIFLYQARIQESKNRNMLKPYQKMDDRYRGVKLNFDITRYFEMFGFPVGFGLNYEIHEGYLFGLETGHRLGATLKVF